MWSPALNMACLRVLCVLGMVPGVWGLLLFSPAWAQAPEPPDPVSWAVHQDEYDNLEVHAGGGYHLRRAGTQVTATFSSVGSAVQYATRQQPQALFTVPVGYRPAESEIREVEGWPVEAGQRRFEVQIPVRFRVQVASNGEVRYLDGPELDEVGHLAYTLTLGWRTNGTTGRYRDQEAHHDGNFALQRTGQAVTLHLGTVRSPVQHFARQAPADLFTVPDGYRPTETVFLEVTALRPVDVDGELLDQPPVTEVFRVQVTPEGAVRYVDDAGVDEVGYLAYTAMGQWETGDAPLWTAVPSPPDGADLCTRNPAVQDALLEALGGGRDCASVTWAELAALPSLHLEVGSGHPVLMKRDLAGLSMLTQLTLSAPEFQRFWWGRDLLADLPRLRTLEIDLYSPKLPAALLQAVPHLGPVLDHWQQEQARMGPDWWMRADWSQHQAIQAEWSRWDSALLTPVPHLEQLTFGGLYLTAANSDFLNPTPRLRRLILDGAMRSVPPKLLAPVPQLEHLTLRSPFLKGTSSLPSTLLTPVPQLRSLHLHVGGYFERNYFFEVTLPKGLLAPVPNLESLTLVGHFGVWPDLLAYTPRLRYLGGVTLRLLLLGDLENLHHLERVAYNFPWPSRSATVWQDIAVKAEEMPYLQSFNALGTPPIVLVPLSFLQQLVTSHPGKDHELLQPGEGRYLEEWLVDKGQLTELQFFDPNDYLQPFSSHSLQTTPRLKYLTLKGPKALPPAFLSAVPHLQGLEFQNGYRAREPWALPGDLLTYTPELRHLDLSYPFRLEDLPPDWLSPVPRLQALHLYPLRFGSLPAGLLAPVPGLQEFSLAVQRPVESNGNTPGPRLELPVDFLGHTPGLESLQLGDPHPWWRPFEDYYGDYNIAALRYSYPIYDQRPRILDNRLGTLRGPYPAELPSQRWVHLSSLPSTWLAPVPALRTLKLGLAGRALPETLLVPVSGLRHLELGVGHTVLPTRLLQPVPGLQNLVLNLHQVSLPAGLLTDLPSLRQLTLQSDSLERPSRDFLAQAPQLRTLLLITPFQEVMWEDLLVRSPYLREVWLGSDIEFRPRPQ